jgi:hypothetical protein
MRCGVGKPARPRLLRPDFASPLLAAGSDVGSAGAPSLTPPSLSPALAVLRARDCVRAAAERPRSRGGRRDRLRKARDARRRRLRRSRVSAWLPGLSLQPRRLGRGDAGALGALRVRHPGRLHPDARGAPTAAYVRSSLSTSARLSATRGVGPFAMALICWFGRLLGLGRTRARARGRTRIPAAR